MKYISDDFSLEMLANEGALIRVSTVSSFPRDAKSIVRNEMIANLLEVDYNIEDVKLQNGDTLYVTKLTYDELKKDCTELPEGFKFQFFKVRVTDK